MADDDDSSGKGLFSLLFSLIKLAIFVVIIAIAYNYYLKFTANKERIEEYNRISKLNHEKKYQETIDGFKVFWEKYPKYKDDGRMQVRTAYANLGDAEYNLALTKKDKSKYKAAAAYYDSGAAYGNHELLVVQNWLDAHFELGNYDRVRQILKDAEARDDLSAKSFTVMRKRLERVK